MAKSPKTQPRTATGKKASPDTRTEAEHKALEGVMERTEEGHRKAGREPDKQALVSSGPRAVRRVVQRLLDADLRDLPMLTEDEKLLQSPGDDLGAFTRSDPWRVMRITSEFVEGFDALAQITKGVTVFGSARTGPDDPQYQAARETSRLLAIAGFSIITGAGPGIMEAANRGAAEAGAPSVGFNITLPHEQEPNAFSTPELTFRFHYFSMRKMHLAMRAKALVVFPGGFGTFDELFEILTLTQTEKAPPVPIVLFDRAYWTRVFNFEALAEEGMIGAADLQLFCFAETAEEAWAKLVERGVMAAVEQKIT